MNEKKNYHTRQRDVILSCMREEGGAHFTAGDIALKMQNRGEGVGLATIYRLLDKMVEEGQIRKFITGSGNPACYQLPETENEACRHHYHLKCGKCGRLFHVECEHIDEFTAHLLEEHGFQVDHSKTVFYGLCRECAEEK